MSVFKIKFYKRAWLKNTEERQHGLLLSEFMEPPI